MSNSILKSLFKVSQGFLLKETMPSFLEEAGYELIIGEKYIYAVGSPVALVVHLDTVFSKPPTDIYHDEQQNVMWSPQGLGADDRAGLYAVMQMVTSGLRPTIILTADEELGGLGSLEMIAKHKKPPSRINYIVNLDRQGKDDSVFYECDNPSFTSFINSFGFKTQRGTYSDISFIAPVWGVAAANLSIGYQNEHSYLETLHLDDMQNTIAKVCKMISGQNDIAFQYVKAKLKVRPWISYGYGKENLKKRPL